MLWGIRKHNSGEVHTHGEAHSHGTPRLYFSISCPRASPPQCFLLRQQGPVVPNLIQRESGSPTHYTVSEETLRAKGMEWPVKLSMAALNLSQS